MEQRRAFQVTNEVWERVRDRVGGDADLVIAAALASDKKLDYMAELWRACGDLIETVGPGRRARRGLHILHPDDAFQVLAGRRHLQFPKGTVSYQLMRLVLGDGLITSNGEHWRRQRRIMQPTFTPSYIDWLTAGFCAVADAFVDEQRARASAPEDLGALMVDLALRQAVHALFGTDLPPEHQAAVADGMTYLLHLFHEAARRPFAFRRGLDAAGRQRLTTFHDIVTRIIQERAAAPADDHGDVLSRLLTFRHEDTGERMPEAQLRDEVLTLMLAGHETTAAGMTWALYVLARDPDLQERVRAEVRGASQGGAAIQDAVRGLAYTRQVLQEVLRLYPPVGAMLRESTEEFTMGGEVFPPGTGITIWQYFIHRHPGFWTDPERFDPERFAPGVERHPFAYMPFSAGPRTCLGMGFAMTEMLVNLAALLQAFRVEVEPGDPIPPDVGVSLRPMRPIVGTLQPLG